MFKINSLQKLFLFVLFFSHRQLDAKSNVRCKKLVHPCLDQLQPTQPTDTMTGSAPLPLPPNPPSTAAVPTAPAPRERHNAVATSSDEPDRAFDSIRGRRHRESSLHAQARVRRHGSGWLASSRDRADRAREAIGVDRRARGVFVSAFGASECTRLDF